MEKREGRGGTSLLVTEIFRRKREWCASPRDKKIYDVRDARDTFCLNLTSWIQYEE